MAARADRETVQLLQREFLKVPGGCLAAIAAIHVLPKPQGGSGFRFLLMVAYFAAALVFLYQMTAPRAAYMRQLYAWRYQDCGPVMEQNWKLFLSSLDRAVTMAVYALGAFVAANALWVLSFWVSAFSALSFLYSPVWWISLGALILFPFWGGAMLSEVFQRHRLLQEAVETSDYKPRSMADLQAAGPTVQRATVEPLGDKEFHAGGFDWSWEDFYKNSIIFGQSGTGKTVCVLNALLEGLLASTARSEHPPSGLILDPKGDFLSKIATVCRKYRRDRDLLIINPEDAALSIRWNPLDSTDDELEVSARFAAALETVGSKGGSEDVYWIDMAKKFIRHSIALLRSANEPGDPPTFEQINKLATSFAYVSECADLVAADDPRGDNALAYFADEWINLPDNTRGSVMSFISNMIDPFLMPKYLDVFGAKSTYRMADILKQGKILYVYMPIAEKEAMSKVICTLVKLEYYREVLKVPNKPRPSFFLCDEFQAFFTSMPGKGDADFFERSRQSNHANIIATQNYPALLKTVGDKESIVKNLLGNCAVKMFLRNTDATTNQYASELFGEAIVAMAGANLGAGQGKLQVGSSSASANRQYDRKVRPEEFTHLAIPSKRDSVDYAETVVHLASRGFVTKEKLRWRVHPLEK